ncbi:hypothetical protein ACLRDC_07495 [Gluconacetobacter sacchari]|uniref:hypothetical protein n=1 Tax=Gluconacetobacter sacchari TaxID=92759 RepID=UPI0039B6222B
MNHLYLCLRRKGRQIATAKRVILLAACSMPHLAFAQLVQRPNHTLPQFRNLMPSKGNISAGNMGVAAQPYGSLIRNTPVLAVYEDGSDGTLGQIGRMADNSVQQTDIGRTVASLDSDGHMPADVSGSVSSAQVNISTPHSVPRVLATKLREHPAVTDYGASLGADDSAHDIPLFEKAYADNRATGTGYLEIPPGFWPHKGDGSIWTEGTPQYMYLKFLGSVGWNHKGWSNIWNQLNSDLIEQYVNRTLEFDRAFLSPDAWPVPTTIYNQLFANQGMGRSYNGITEAIRINQENHAGVPGSMVGISVYQRVSGDKGYANQHASLHLDTVRTGVDGVWNLWPSVEDKLGYGPDSVGHAPQQFDGMEMDYSGNGSDRTQLLGGGGRTFIRFVPSAFQHWKKWSPRTSYNGGDMIMDGGRTGIYRVVKSGTSAAVEPRLSRDSVTIDGGVAWEFVNTVAVEQGHAILFGGGGNNNMASYNNLMGGDAHVNLAVLDTSNMILNETSGAVLRASDDQPLDLCGKTDNDAPIVGRYNQCTLQHSYDRGAFVFSARGDAVLTVADNGILHPREGVSLPIKSRSEIRAMVAPKGTVVYDSEDDVPAIYTSKGWKLVALTEMPSQ